MNPHTRVCTTKESHSFLAAIVEKSGDAIVRADLDGAIAGWSAGATHLYGYTAAEMCDSSLGVLVPDERWDEFVRLLEVIRAGVPVNHRETFHHAKDGR